MNVRYVYFAEACGMIKIGCSNQPATRIGQIGEWVPYPITLLATMEGGYALEKALHKMFHADWSHGEWFHNSAALSLFVHRVKHGMPVAIDVAAVETEFSEMVREKKLMKRRIGRLPIATKADLLRDFDDPIWKGRKFSQELRTKFIDTLSAHNLWDAAA